MDKTSLTALQLASLSVASKILQSEKITQGGPEKNARFQVTTLELLFQQNVLGSF